MTEVRPHGGVVDARPGNAYALTVTFPNGHGLDLDAFEATFNGDAVAPTVDGDVLTVVLSEEMTEAVGNGYDADLLLSSVEAGGVALGERFRFSDDLAPTGPTAIEREVTLAEIALDVTIVVAPAAGGSGGGGVVEEVVAGAGITVDDSDPAHPIVTAEVTQAELDAEAATRAAADTALDGRVDALEAVDPLTQGEGDARYWQLSTDLATQAELDASVTGLVNGAPAGGDTLGELHARLAIVEALGSLATDAELVAAVAALIGSADTAGDTLGELQALIGLRLLTANNLSDVPNKGTARTNLGLAIGTDVQAYSAALLDLASRWAAASASGPATLDLREDSDNGTNRVRFTVPASLTADRTLTAPDASGTVALADAFVPIITRRHEASGTLSLSSTSGTWTDLDPTGSSSSRSLDIVIPNAVAGKSVLLGLNLATNNGAGTVYLDFVSIVAGAKVNHTSANSGSTGGWGGWICLASAFNYKAGMVPYVLQSGDIENGSARFRLQYVSTGAKNIFADSSSTWPLVLFGQGPFG